MKYAKSTVTIKQIFRRADANQAETNAWDSGIRLHLLLSVFIVLLHHIGAALTKIMRMLFQTLDDPALSCLDVRAQLFDIFGTSPSHGVIAFSFTRLP